MRLWSLNPCYLDARGLIALWREALLARAVLKGRTKGYKHHPQLARFKSCPRPLSVINCYLRAIFSESRRRGYNFDSSKLDKALRCPKITVTEGQLLHEWSHLKTKLKDRDPERHRLFTFIGMPHPHPLFKVRAGSVEAWEKGKRSP